MGLLDNLLKGTGDPEKDRALSQGLLQAGLSLLASKGNFGSALGQAGMAGVQGYQGAQEMSYRDQQRKMQMEQLKRQQQLQQQQDAWRQNAVSPQMQASQAALGGGGGPTMANAAKTQAVDPNRQMLFEAMQAGVVDPQTYIQALQKEKQRKLLNVPRGGTVIDEATGAPVYSAPAEADELPSGMRMGQNGPEWVPGYLEGKMRLARAGASNTSVSYGAPMAGVDKATGEPVFFRPPKGSGPPEIVPGVRPPPKDPKDPTEFQDKAGLYFKSMVTASETLDKVEAKGGARVPIEEAMAPDQVQNVVRNPRRQAYVQAQRQWIDSINRVRSGANLPEMEYGRAVKTFFPEYGDRPEIVQQKAAARKQEEVAMRAAAGRALQNGQQAPANPGAVLRFDAQGNPVN